MSFLLLFENYIYIRILIFRGVRFPSFFENQIKKIVQTNSFPYGLV